METYRILDSSETYVLIARGNQRKIVTFNMQPSAFVLTDDPIEDEDYQALDHKLVFDRKTKTYVYKTTQSKAAVDRFLGQRAHQTYGFDVSNCIRLFADSGIKRSGMVYLDACNNISPAPDEDTKSVPLRTFFFDFEVYSANHESFPNPYHYNEIIYMASTIHMVGDEIKSFVGMVGPMACIKETPEFTVVVLESEYDLIKWFLNDLNSFDPDFISGYNLGFDIGYLEKRCILTDIELKISRNGGPKNVNVKYPLECFGRVVMDVYDYFKPLRAGYALERLTLNAVAENQLGEFKVDLPYKVQFQQYKAFLENSRADPNGDHIPYELCRYCHIDSMLALRLYRMHDLNSKAIAFSNTYSATIRNVIQGSTSIKFAPFLWRYISGAGYVFNKDSEPLKSRKVSGGYVLMSRPGIHVNSFIGDFASLYPSIIIANNICWSTVEPDDFVPTDLSTHRAVEISYVLEDVDITKTLYFKRTPQGIVPRMLEDMLVRRKEAKKIGGIDGNNLQLAYKNIANSICGFLGCRSSSRYVYAELNVAITHIGQRYIQYINKRITERSLRPVHIYSDTDSSMVNVYTKPYGQLSLDIPQVDFCANSVETAYYESLSHLIDGFLMENSKILKIAERMIAFGIAHSMCQEITKEFPVPVKFEFETFVPVGIFMARKLYIAMKQNDPTDMKYKPKYSGVCIKKTNYSKFLKMYYAELVDCIVNMDNIQMVPEDNSQMLAFDAKSKLWSIVLKWAQNLQIYCNGPITSDIFALFSIETKFKTAATTTNRSPLKAMYQRALDLGKPFVDNTAVIYCMANGDKYTKDMLEVDPWPLDKAYYANCMHKLLMQLVYFRPPNLNSGLRVDLNDFTPI